jgi:Stress responsive A/B Barrel Domain
MEERVLQRIVLLKWKPGTSEEQVHAALEKADALTEIPGVERITFGHDTSGSAHGYTHALVIELNDESALAGYLDHPIRRRYHEEQLAPIEDQRIELDLPVERTLRPDVGSEWRWAPGVGMRVPLEE